jgi:RNA polymerase sigma-70 factor, ECF subfamily
VGMEEERLWALRAQQGDQDAFACIVDAYQRPVYNLAYRMLGTAEEAEDASQEAFLRVYTRLETYDPSRKLSSWVLSIVSHHCIDRLRKRRGHTVSMEDVEAERWLPDHDPLPEETSLDQERDAHIRFLLATLPPQYRLYIILRYWHDMSYEEIAEITSTTQSAVKSRLHRARRAMAEALQQPPAAAPVNHPMPRRTQENVLPEGF